MDVTSDLPVTGVCVVSDPNRTPPNYTVIDRTFDKSEDADLWKDGIFGRRTMRYLCVERSVPQMTQGKDVLIDVAFINEKDPPPAGFTVIENTVDTGEKALKKKLLCCRWMLPSMTNDAITELVFLSRATRKPPAGYTLVGETNNMSLCYKMGKISRPPTTSAPAIQGYSAPAPTLQGYPTQAYNMAPMAATLPYPPRSPNATLMRRLSQGGSTSAVNAPIAGIPFQLNPRYQAMAQVYKLTVPEIRYKSMLDIEHEYEYDFQVERQAVRVEPDRR